MVARVVDESWGKRCKKASGDDHAFEKSEKAEEEFDTCFENFHGGDEVMKSYNKSLETGDFKPMFKA